MFVSVNLIVFFFGVIVAALDLIVECQVIIENYKSGAVLLRLQKK